LVGQRATVDRLFRSRKPDYNVKALHTHVKIDHNPPPGSKHALVSVAREVSFD
jgi:hypothetical protein